MTRARRSWKVYIVVALALGGCHRDTRFARFVVAPPDPPLGRRCRDDGGGPLKDWMKNNLKPVFVSTDAADQDAVPFMLDALAEIAPDAYRDWAYWALKAAKAARRRSFENVRAACQGCHDAYSVRYCADDRARRMEEDK
jgi:hypothetical protein